MKDPAFLFYTNDFIGGVSDLTMEERGQYITLLCLQHQKGHLSEKIIQLNVGNTTVDVLNKFQKDENGLLYNVRLDAEIEKRRQHSEKQRANIQKRWGGKDVGSEVGNTVVLPLENENENRNVIDNTNTKDRIEKFDFKQSLINLVANEKMVSYFMEARKKKQLVNTEAALSLFIKEVEKVGMTVAEAVEYCAGRSWGGFRAEYINKDEAGIDYFNGQDETDMINSIQQMDDFTWNMQRSKLVFDETINCLYSSIKNKYISFQTLKKCDRLMKHAADIFLAKSITLTPANYGKRK